MQGQVTKEARTQYEGSDHRKWTMCFVYHPLLIPCGGAGVPYIVRREARSPTGSFSGL